jgi:hypothetical protein
MSPVHLRARLTRGSHRSLKPKLVWPALLSMIGTAEPFLRLGAILFWLLGPRTSSPVGYRALDIFLVPLLLAVFGASAVVPLSFSIVLLVNPANRIIWATILLVCWLVEIDLFVPVFILSLFNPTGPYGSTPLGFTPLIGLVGAVWALLQKTQSESHV